MILLSMGYDPESAVGQVSLLGGPLPELSDVFLTRDLDKEDAGRLTVYQRPTEEKDYRIADTFPSNLGISGNASVNTVGSIDDRLEDTSAADHLDIELRSVARAFGGTHLDDELLSLPEETTDGTGPPPDTQLTRQVKKTGYACVQLGRGGDWEKFAIDITGWPWFSIENDPPGTQSEKPSLDYDKSWQFATISLVDVDLPFTIGVREIASRKNKQYNIQHLLDLTESKFDIKRVYVDRGFYSSAVRDEFDSRDLDFVMMARRNMGLFYALVDGASWEDREINHVPYQISTDDEDDYEHQPLGVQRRSGATDE